MSAAIAFVAAFIILSPATAMAVEYGSIKGTVHATTGAQNAPETPLPGARVTLINRDIPSTPLTTVADDAGNFAFTGLAAATYDLIVEGGGLPATKQEIRLAPGAKLTVEVKLTASVSENVTVHDEEGLLSTADTTTSNVVRSESLRNLPLRAENYQSALPLTPGVVRTADGADHVKGTRAGQSAYTVNGADVTDPFTGNLAFDVPIEAAASVQIEENPYSAEFGRLAGGATNLETRGGTNKFSFTAARFFPTFRYILSGPVDSFRPRVTFSGPIVRDRVFFLQSFEYRFTRLRMSSLPAGARDSTSQSFNSFSQADIIVNKAHRLKLVASFFPQSARFVGLNTFNPQEATPDVRQRGSLFSASEQTIFGDASFLSSALSYKTFDVDVVPRGAQPLTLRPDGNTGNYFADSRRRTRRWQWQETYYARPFKFRGEHSFKAGTEFNRTGIASAFRDNSILVRQGGGALRERIDFTGAGSVALHTNEFAAFVQDRWVASTRLTIDAGLRLDRDAISRQTNIAPRLALLLVPDAHAKTIIRGGIGLFYERTPMSAGYLEAFPGDVADEEEVDALVADPTSAISRASTFPQLPQRIVTTYGADGQTVIDGPRVFRNAIARRLLSPRSLRWNLQIDRGITKNLTARIGYLERSTRNDLIVKPRLVGTNAGVLWLGSRGRSQYREFQMVANYTSSRVGVWNASYVFSSARGDLNTVDNFLGDLPAYVVRPNQYGRLPFDAPHRFLVYGQLKMRHDVNFSPSFEIRSGFPYSAVNGYLDFVGARNAAGRFPTFMSLDAQVTKGFRIPGFEKHKARIGVAVFNITHHFNPRDVQQNMTSPRFGQFFNNSGTSVRGKFEIDF